MADKEEIGYLISEFESLRDMVIDEIIKIRTELENLKQDFEDLKTDLSSSGIGIAKKRLG